MADVAAPLPEESLPPPTRMVSALRSSHSKPKPKRVHTRVSIVIPESPPTSHDVTTLLRSDNGTKTSPDLTVKTTPWAKTLILTLDGGGIKGYSSLIILRALMTEIASVEQKLEPHAQSSAHTERIPSDTIPDDVLRKGQYLPCHYFDYIAGTSVGGLIAIMLGMLGKSVDDCIDEFRRQNKAIPLPDDTQVIGMDFPLLHRRSTWPTRRTRAFFDTFAKFGATATGRARPQSLQQDPPTSSPATSPDADSDSAMTADSIEFRKDLLQCQTLAWCTEVEEKKARHPYAFCTYREENESQKLISIPEVAKAITTPASASFKPFKLGSGQFVDGSKEIRDPTLEVLKEMTALLHGPGEPPIDLLLSLGTDEHNAWFYEKLRRPSGDVGASTSQIDIGKEEGKSYLHYQRFEVTDIRLGLRKKHYLREIEEATEKWLTTDDQKEKIRQYAQMLVERRRARASTSRWETFALGVRYTCFHDECKAAGRTFDSRGDFYEHLDRKHRLLKEAAKSGLDIEEVLDKGRQFGCT